MHKKDFDYRYFTDCNLDELYDRVFFLSSHLDDFNLRFFGGEPFLQFDTVKKIISRLNQKTDAFHFTINTNLMILDEEKLQFIKDAHVKLIVSCNGDTATHSKSRGISIKETLRLYENIRKVTSNNIDHQINIVVQNENARFLEKNISFIAHALG